MNKKEFLDSLMSVLSESPANISASGELVSDMCEQLKLSKPDVAKICSIVSTTPSDDRVDLLRTVIAASLTPLETTILSTAIMNDFDVRAEDIKEQLMSHEEFLESEQKETSKKDAFEEFLRSQFGDA